MPANSSSLPQAAGVIGTVSDDGLHSPSMELKQLKHEPPRPDRDSVAIGFFDSEGVRELERQMSHASGDHASIASNESDWTLNDDGPFDLNKICRGLKRKATESGIKVRELGVIFKDLKVVGLGATARHQATFGSMLNPMNLLRNVGDMRHPPLRDILHGFEGVVRPGEMLLVLGRPGAGCSTLLKVLANHRSEYHAVEGDVHYDAFTPEEVHKHYRGDVQYCPEDDVHFPTLTVEETLSFAARTRTPHVRLDGESREQHVKRMVDFVTTIFGLRHVRKSLVSDAAIRGVSGGEKKRVSIAEALATLSHFNCWDNSTRGLDASTALEFVQALRIATDMARMSTIVSIYQAGEPLYRLFDKVCVIYNGKMAYFGPASKARQYFIDMGFEPANRQTTADFLVAVTDPNGRIIRSGFESRAPRTAIEFAQAFQRSKLGRTNKQDMDSYSRDFIGNEHKIAEYRQSVHQAHAAHTNPNSSFIISIPMQVRALMTRRVQIIKGGYINQATETAAFIIQAIIIGTIFLKLKGETAAFFSRGGVLYFALLYAALAAMAEIPALYAQRPIVLRHSRAAMYHPFAEALAFTLVDMPMSAVVMGVFSIALYFLVQLEQTASSFFIFMLIVYTMTLTMKAWFRAVAASFRAPASAQTFAGLAMLILVLYTGYAIPQPTMIGALRWITYINPLKYGFEALMVNEFHGRQAECSTIVPRGSGYEGISLANQVCTTVGSLPGQTTVDGNRYLRLAYDYYYSHLWRDYGILLAFGIFFIGCYLFAAEWSSGSSVESSATVFKHGVNAAVIEEDSRLDEENAAGAIALSRDLGDNPNSSDVIPKALKMTDTFSWQHLNYTIPVQDGTRKLLEDVSGYVAPGKLTALVGASGAGKTTLLNVLAQRVSFGVVSGDQFVNGHALPNDFQAQTGYVQQMDTHLATTTVREALLFSAKLRQPASVPVSEKEAYVETCLKMCGLEAYADAIIGSLGVEHRKRTTIAVELAAKPRLLLFLDEPTSGLDSQSSWAIVSFLRSLADSGQAILCTIHQPSSELFEVFDRLLLLKKGGQTVYFGDLGPRSETLIDYFQRNGARECLPDENSAEYMLSAIGAGATAHSEIDWHGVWRNSPEARRLQEELTSIHTEDRNCPAVETAQRSEFAASWLYQVMILTKRDAKDHWRDAIYVISKLALNIVAGLVIGFTFWKAKDSLQGIQNKLFAIYMATLVSIPVSNQLQVVFINMRSVYEIRERPSRMYSWTALVTAQILAEVPWNILGSSLFFLCWFWTVGFPNDRAGYTYLLLCVIYPIFFTTMSQTVAAMSPNAEIGALLYSLFFTFTLLFGGVLQPFSQLNWWRWMYRVSPLTYLIEGLLGQALGGEEITCSAVELVNITPPSGQTCSQFLDPFISTAGGYLTNPTASDACQYCSFRSTDQYMLTSFNIEYGHRWRNVGFMVAFSVVNVAFVYIFTYLFRIRSSGR